MRAPTTGADTPKGLAMLKKILPFIGALALAGSAHAIPINMSDFVFGTPPSGVNMTGTEGSPSYDGVAGEFAGTMDSSLGAGEALRFGLTESASSTSFVAWCAELTQSFSFGVPYDYTLVSGDSYFGTQRTTDLSRLFTAAQGFVIDTATSSALQAGIWEIIYEKGTGGYDLTGGTFFGNGEDAATQAAFGIVNGFLKNLGSFSASYQINVLENGVNQDFLVPTIPEPETWAMLLGGLGALGLLRRRRKG